MGMTGGSKPAYKSLCDLSRMFLFFRVWLLKEKSNHTRKTTCFFLLLWLTSPGNLIQQQLSTAISFLDEWPLCKMNEWLQSSTGGLSKCGPHFNIIGIFCIMAVQWHELICKSTRDLQQQHLQNIYIYICFFCLTAPGVNFSPIQHY